MRRLQAYSLIALVIALCASCRTEIPLVSLGLDDTYKVARMQALVLRPAYTGESYSWTVRTEDGADSLLCDSKDCIFLERRPGV